MHNYESGRYKPTDGPSQQGGAAADQVWLQRLNRMSGLDWSKYTGVSYHTEAFQGWTYLDYLHLAGLGARTDPPPGHQRPTARRALPRSKTR